MTKEKKLYKVGLGLCCEGRDIQNWSSTNVTAMDVPDAIRKVKLRKHTYIESVTVIATVDIG